MIRYLSIVFISLLSAGILTFCAPRPAHAAQPSAKLGQYISCPQLADDVSMMAYAAQRGLLSKHWLAPTDWYSRLVVVHAAAAIESKQPAQYIRDLHKACLLENT